MKTSRTLPACHSIEWLQEAHKLTAQLRQIVKSLQSFAYSESPSSALRLDDVLAQTKDSKSGLYKLIQDGRFPPPFHVGRSSRWLQRDVDTLLEARSRSRLHRAIMEVAK